jgi:paraquat-inducible protein B
MTTLNIVYPNGRMDINIDRFLNDCGVGRFKKLLKIIKMSYTSGVYVKQLKDYISEYLATAGDRIDDVIEWIERAEDEIRTKEAQLITLNHKRNVVKQQLKKILTYTTYKSQEYVLTKESEQELTNEINVTRAELSSLRKGVSENIGLIKHIERNVKNFNKYLELLKDV